MNPNLEKRPAATVSELPVEVIVDIFSRLPVKNLLRFRCVSKQFLSIIDGQDFVKRHLQFHSLRQKIIFQGINSELYLFDLDSVDNTYKLELPFDHWQRDNYIDVIGSCDGLLAIKNFPVDTIGLWNVSTKKHRILSRCVFRYVFDCYGFGRYPGSNDYKLVRILKSKGTTKVSVYSSETNSWRLIDSVPPYSNYRLCGNGALVEGTLNWKGNCMLDDDRIKNFIVSYHLKNEIFREVLLPDSIEHCTQGSTLNLKVWGGRLCLLYGYANPSPNPSRRIDIWVMKEHGLKNSWVKMHSFPEEGVPVRLVELPVGHVEFPFVSFYVNTEYRSILSRIDFYYDLENGKYEIKNGKLPLCIRNAIDYMESLVWPSLSI